jgi:hypothetical protein
MCTMDEGACAVSLDAPVDGRAGNIEFATLLNNRPIKGLAVPFVGFAEVDSRHFCLAFELHGCGSSLRSVCFDVGGDQELHAHEGPDNPDLVIEPGDTPLDPDGSATMGSHSALLEVPALSGDDYKGSFVTVSDSVINNGDTVQDVLEHEVAHVHDARTNTNQYWWD